MPDLPFVRCDTQSLQSWRERNHHTLASCPRRAIFVTCACLPVLTHAATPSCLHQHLASPLLRYCQASVTDPQGVMPVAPSTSGCRRAMSPSNAATPKGPLLLSVVPFTPAGRPYAGPYPGLDLLPEHCTIHLRPLTGGPLPSGAPRRPSFEEEMEVKRQLKQVQVALKGTTEDMDLIGRLLDLLQRRSQDVDLDIVDVKVQNSCQSSDSCLRTLTISSPPSVILASAGVELTSLKITSFLADQIAQLISMIAFMKKVG